MTDEPKTPDFKAIRRKYRSRGPLYDYAASAARTAAMGVSRDPLLADHIEACIDRLIFDWTPENVSSLRAYVARAAANEARSYMAKSGAERRERRRYERKYRFRREFGPSIPKDYDLTGESDRATLGTS